MRLHLRHIDCNAGATVASVSRTGSKPTQWAAGQSWVEKVSAVDRETVFTPCYVDFESAAEPSKLAPYLTHFGMFVFRWELLVPVFPCHSSAYIEPSFKVCMVRMHAPEEGCTCRV